MIVAWHEVPGKAPPQESRPVGYGMICAGVRTDSKIGGRVISNVLSLSGIVGSAAPDHTVPYGTVLSRALFQALRAWLRSPVPPGQKAIRPSRASHLLWDQLRPIIPYPTGGFFRGVLSQALRAWPRSACPSGTKSDSPIKGPRLRLALMVYAFLALPAVYPGPSPFALFVPSIRTLYPSGETYRSVPAEGYRPVS